MDTNKSIGLFGMNRKLSLSLFIRASFNLTMLLNLFRFAHFVDVFDCIIYKIQHEKQYSLLFPITFCKHLRFFRQRKRRTKR